MAKIKFRTGADTVAIPRAAAEMEPELSELDLRLIFHLAAQGEIAETELDALASSFGCSRNEIDMALSFLRGAGILDGTTRRGRVVKAEEEPEKEPKPAGSGAVPGLAAGLPVYTAKEVERIFSSHADLKDLLEECQAIIGKVFNTAEANTILGFRDYLGVSNEYILMLCANCVERGKKSMRYIEKTALSLHDEGVDTPEALEAYFVKREQYDSAEGKIRKLFGVGSRALSAKENAIVSKWTTEWKLPFDLIEYAYELTVNAIHEASFPYSDKILGKWKEAGILTVDAAKTSSDKREGEKKDGGKTFGNFDTEDFFEASLRRSYSQMPDSDRKE